ncbi:MAG: DegQ family serine endoprotease [Alphaproteobacteria bacterium]|nr:DegQ family serine endoprotease [Alphaproteobacteria bacterium]
MALAGLSAAPAMARAAPDSFADIVQTLTPAVVHVSTTQTVPMARGGMEELDELFRDLLPPGEAKRTSLGSGFVIDPKGIIVTNNHVIDKADEITVTLDHGEKLPAEIIGRDVSTDIAVLRVQSKRQLPYVKLGNSDGARVGDWVVAIGNPFNLGGTVTAGIISARNREIGGRYDDYIQTDASINRGNSGGPLFNLEGEVIGVNTAIFSQTGGSIGIGFAVPSNLVKRVVDQIMEFGETRRGWLGVTIQEVTPEIAEIAGLDKPRGAMVSGFADKSPAREAGMERGDIIVKFDGREVADIRTLVRVVADTKIGAAVPVEIVREGKSKTIKVTVGQLEEEKVSDASGTPDLKKFSGGEKGYGLTLSELTPKLRERFNLPEDANGVLVTDVDPDSPIANDVHPGDVIVEVAQKEVAKPKDVFDRMESETKDKANKPVLILLDRGGSMLFVGVRVENSRND